MASPPNHIKEFRNQVQQLSREALAQLPNYVARHDSTFDSALLERSFYGRNDNYWDIQHVCFDYSGTCAVGRACPQTMAGVVHAHGMAGPQGYQVKGFPGLYFYPRLFGHYDTQIKLLDSSMHHELSNPTSTTNVHEKYHVQCPSNADGTKASFFDPVARNLHFQPRLDQVFWTERSITSRDLIQKLRWLQFGVQPGTEGQTSLQLPTDMKRLMDNALDIPADYKSAAAYLNSPEETSEMRQHGSAKAAFLHVSLGCQAVYVIGRDSNSREATSQSTEQPSHSTIALTLGTGDALLFTGESRQAWYSVAKVIVENDEHWISRWPYCLHHESANKDRQNWRGILRDRSIDLVISD